MNTTIPLISSFILILFAELGDKTQLVTIILSSRSSAIQVFIGSMLAFLLVDGLSTIIGGTLLSLLPYQWIHIFSGIVFITFGILPLTHRENVKIKEKEITFLKTFSMVSLMELGDKTQLAAIVLAAETGSPILVLLGIMLAFFLVTGIGVTIGAKILRLLPERYLKLGASLLFISFGVISILKAIMEIEMLPSFLTILFKNSP